ncbi:hypothetical protein [Vibrio neptunius]|uniref:hypothetical protein n=1 Tax=Vibrio neptunius TaxID=170651 RepID=UPI0019D147C1|nr:hypothetical protein [Vibrio neptunius]MBN3574384.1 hypothetical protein [Vibrio neptunius]
MSIKLKAALCCLVVILCNSVFYWSKPSHNEAVDSVLFGFVSVLESWVQSPTVIDDVYTFNYQALTNRMSLLIDSYESIDWFRVCLELDLQSFSTKDEVQKTVCSGGNTLLSLTQQQYKLDAGVSELMIGKKKLGHINWYFFSKNEYQQLGLNVILFIASSTLPILLILYIYRANHYVKEQDGIQSHENDIDEYKRENSVLKNRITNISKIISRNRKLFAYSDEIAFAKYTHPYSEVLMTNGIKHKIRCTLTELENSFSDDFIRLSRSIILRESIIKNNASIKIDGGEHYIEFSIKSQTHRLPISKSCVNNIITTENA